MDNEERGINEQDGEELVTQAAVDSKSLIAVTQLPVIEERLREYKAEIEATVKDAKSMIATADTIQAVKAKRAELRKQFDDLDKRRIAVKGMILEPYERFNKVYKECVEIPFKDADAALKSTVDGFEDELKAAAYEKLKANYEEHCQLEGIDFLPFDKALSRSGIKIGMADAKTKTPRKAMDALAEFVSKIALGMDDVRKMDNSAEIMVEFKKCLDAGQAAAIVQERKRNIQQAAESENRRKEEAARQQEMVAKVEAAAPTPATVAAPTAAPTPVADPTQTERVFPEFRFTVYNCTRSQLIKIRDFLRNEGIQYG